MVIARVLFWISAFEMAELYLCSGLLRDMDKEKL
jgi:hypothetical protein